MGQCVCAGDYDNDGFADLFVTYWGQNRLLRNAEGAGFKDGTFADEALFRGATPDIVCSNFSDERSTLYMNRGEGDFDEATVEAGMGANTRYVGWGTGFLDSDNDGLEDLLLVNGHVFPEVDQMPGDLRYRERAILYRNLGDGRFSDVSESSGPGILEPHAARGAAFADADNDGRPDVLVNNQNEPPSLLALREQPEGGWIVLQLEGTAANRSAIGARVRPTAAGRT